MTQDERLDYLIRELVKENPDFWDTEIPDTTREREDLLRTLMNVRPPGEADEAFLRVQDVYLSERLDALGVTDGDALPPVPADDRLVLWQGDITRLKADVVVNAANAQMLGCFHPLHACIDNQIHTYAGIQLRLACDRQMKKIREKLGESYLQPTGIPMITDAYNLPAKKIVHVVGPVIQGDVTREQEEQLSACYRNTLILCARNGLKSVAFCCISTGEFHFPQRRAAEIAVDAVRKQLDSDETVRRVIFNVWKDEDRQIYQGLLS